MRRSEALQQVRNSVGIDLGRIFGEGNELKNFARFENAYYDRILHLLLLLEGHIFNQELNVSENFLWKFLMYIHLNFIVEINWVKKSPSTSEDECDAGRLILYTIIQMNSHVSHAIRQIECRIRRERMHRFVA